MTGGFTLWLSAVYGEAREVPSGRLLWAHYWDMPELASRGEELRRRKGGVDDGQSGWSEVEDTEIR